MKPLTIIAVTAFFAAPPALAQTAGHDTTDHSMHQTQPADASGMDASPLTEPGQGAFAALSEVVQVLEADPDTDWSKVNLTDLRDHLVDMDVLVRSVSVTQTELPNGLKSVVTGVATVLESAKRMVPAHAHELARDPGWNVETTTHDANVVLIVTSDDPATAQRIKGLGFFGLMASQDHHRAHHYIIAKGGDAHSGH